MEGQGSSEKSLESVQTVSRLEKPRSSKKYSFSLLTLLVILLAACAIWAVTAVISYYLTKASLRSATQTPEYRAAVTEKPKGPSAQELRLPKDLLPIHYDWTVKLFLPYQSVNYPVEKNFTFHGRLTITFECIRATKIIRLNQNRLNFTSDGFELILNSDATKSIALRKITPDSETQMVDFVLQEGLEAGKTYNLSIKYRGPISDDVLTGIYRSSYKDGGKTIWLAATQMSPIDARRALPCFDEPEMKAKFTTTVIHPRGTVALANGIEIDLQVDVADTEGSGWVKTTFNTSPKMSTYVLGLVVAPFVYTEKYTDRGIRFRIWARPSMVNQTSYAMDAGIKCLTYLEKYYGIRFPMHKQDMVALPDFKFGAMENWGLITYREKLVLYDPNVYSLSNKQLIAAIISHELAHQWFGNLATMKWWDDLWLKEGFASLMEYIGADVISDGAFHMDDQILSDAMHKAMSRDQLATSHPLYGPVAKIQDLYEIFDSISYDKGASVIHMVSNVIGPENFRNGLMHYLDTYQYSNGDHNDLWNSLSEAMFTQSRNPVLDWNSKPLNISTFASSWTLQMGFPLINVTRDTMKIFVEQKRFKLDEKSVEKPKYRTSPYGYKWHVPLWYQFGSQSEPKLIWLTPENTTNSILRSKSSNWFLINPGGRGYYRVLYDQQGWQDLAAQLSIDHSKIPVKSRAALIDDAFTFARAGMLSYETALMLTEYLENEENYMGWQAALGSFGFIEKRFQSEPGYEYLRNYLLKLVYPQYQKTDWAHQTEDVFVQNLASTVISRACDLELEDCVEKCQNLAFSLQTSCSDEQQLLSTTCNIIPGFLRETVYCTSIKHGDTDVWDYFWEKYQNEQLHLEKDRILRSLTCTDQIWLLHKLLDESLKDEIIRRQDVPSLWYSIAGQTIGSQILWGYMASNWDQIYETFGQTAPTMEAIVAASTYNFKTRYQIQQLLNFLIANPEAKEFNVFDLRLEIARANTDWMKANYENLERWFRDRSDSASIL